MTTRALVTCLIDALILTLPVVASMSAAAASTQELGIKVDATMTRFCDEVDGAKGILVFPVC